MTEKIIERIIVLTQISIDFCFRLEIYRENTSGLPLLNKTLLGLISISLRNVFRDFDAQKKEGWAHVRGPRSVPHRYKLKFENNNSLSVYVYGNRM